MTEYDRLKRQKEAILAKRRDSQQQLVMDSSGGIGIKQIVAVRLQKAIDMAGMTRSDIAAKLGWSKPMVTKALSGHENLTLDTLDKIARAAGALVQVTLHIP